MKDFDFVNQVKNLPDSFDKRAESNNYKILEVEKYAVNDLRNDIEDVDDVLDLANAKGKTLDLYGEMLSQPRGATDDEKYLMLIRAKIMRNLSGGDLKSIVRAICSTLNCTVTEVRIEETNDPCTVEITDIPLDRISSIGLSATQTAQVIKSLLPVGVKLETIIFDGTFEFSDTDSETSYTAGFSSLVEKTATADTTYQANKNYYTLSGTTYTLLIEGIDYDVGDEIEGTVYEDYGGYFGECVANDEDLPI